MHIAVSGYYGCGNTGDEAVLAGILESFAQCGYVGRVEFTVFSANPAATEQQHSVKAVDRMNLRLLRQTLIESNLLLSGGGSLLQDATSLRSLLYYLWVVRLASACGTPVMFYAQGIGPLRRRLSRVLVRMVANRVQFISVRDAASAALLQKIGVNRPPIEVTADPSFTLRAEEWAAVEKRLRAAGVPADRPLLGVALRPRVPGSAIGSGGRDRKMSTPGITDYAYMIDLLAQKTDAHPVLVTMQPPEDLPLAEQVAKCVRSEVSILREPLAPRAAVGIIGAMTGLVAMRLHALIFGVMGGVPLVALSYDPKVASLMEDLGQGERCILLKDFAPMLVAEQMEEALSEGRALRERLLARAAEMATRARVNVERAMALAGKFCPSS